jgi:hypothetical protein
MSKEQFLLFIIQFGLLLTVARAMGIIARRLNQPLLQKKDGFISFLFGWALVTVIFLVVLLFQFLSFSNPAEIKKLKGHGTVQTYGFPYEEVFQATVYSINEKGFTIVESDKEDGYIVAAEGRDFFITEG